MSSFTKSFEPLSNIFVILLSAVFIFAIIGEACSVLGLFICALDGYSRYEHVHGCHAPPVLLERGSECNTWLPQPDRYFLRYSGVKKF